jgi:hypothetical protein
MHLVQHQCIIVLMLIIDIVTITTIMTAMDFRLQPLLQYIYLCRSPSMPHLHLDVHTAQTNQRKEAI